jgi:hypothetical protein
LVTVTDGVVTDSDYDCGVDGSSCADAGLWELGGSDGVVVYDSTYECADWTAAIGSLPVTGVMMFRWERRRIVPRISTDLGSD